MGEGARREEARHKPSFGSLLTLFCKPETQRAVMGFWELLCCWLLPPLGSEAAAGSGPGRLQQDLAARLFLRCVPQAARIPRGCGFAPVYGFPPSPAFENLSHPRVLPWIIAAASHPSQWFPS